MEVQATAVHTSHVIRSQDFFQKLAQIGQTSKDRPAHVSFSNPAGQVRSGNQIEVIYSIEKFNLYYSCQLEYNKPETSLQYLFRFKEIDYWGDQNDDSEAFRKWVMRYLTIDFEFCFDLIEAEENTKVCIQENLLNLPDGLLIKAGWKVIGLMQYFSTLKSIQNLFWNLIKD